MNVSEFLALGDNEQGDIEGILSNIGKKEGKNKKYYPCTIADPDSGEEIEVRVVTKFVDYKLKGKEVCLSGCNASEFRDQTYYWCNGGVKAIGGSSHSREEGGEDDEVRGSGGDWNMTWKEREYRRYSSMCTGYAKDLVVAGIIKFAEMYGEIDRMVAHIYGESTAIKKEEDEIPFVKEAPKDGKNIELIKGIKTRIEACVDLKGLKEISVEVSDAIKSLTKEEVEELTTVYNKKQKDIKAKTLDK